MDGKPKSAAANRVEKGWYDKDGRYFPILTDQVAAPQISWTSLDVTAKWDLAIDSVRVELMDLNVPMHVACAEVFAQMSVQFIGWKRHRLLKIISKQVDKFG